MRLTEGIQNQEQANFEFKHLLLYNEYNTL